MAFKLKNQTPGIQFIVFFSLTVGMILANVVVNTFYFSDVSNLLSDKPITAAQLSAFKWFQATTTIMIFIVPPLLYGWLSDEKPLQYIGLKPGPKVPYFLLIILLLVVIQPFTMLLSDLNHRMDFGETIRKMDEMTDKAMAKFLVMNSPSDLLVNLVVVALLPAIGEELFFRGSLQNILERWTRQPIIAVVLSSAFFAFFHLSFYKFLPIFTLGLALGFIFHITRNLWYCIFFHFVNNSLALAQNYYASRNEFMKELSNDQVKLHWSIGLISLLLTVAIFLFLRKKHPYQPLEKTWHQDVFRNHFNTPS